MSISSLKHQIHRALSELVWIDDAPPPFAHSIRPQEKVACMQLCLPFFTQAQVIFGRKRLIKLMSKRIIKKTFDTYYRDVPLARNEDILDAIEKLHQGCLKLQWYPGKQSPVTDGLRKRIQGYYQNQEISDYEFD